MNPKIGDYKTKDGEEAKILFIDLNANYPLIGAVKCENGWWVPECWDIDGYIYDPYGDYPFIGYNENTSMDISEKDLIL